MEQNEIYTITVFEKNNQDFGYMRKLGYFRNKDEALDILIHNRCDIWEGCYHYAVLETVEEGLYPYNEEQIYFKYDKERNGYFMINPEEEFCVEPHMHINWSIG